MIPPFLSDYSFQPVDAARPALVPAAREYVMFAGPLGPQKGFDVLLEAWEGFDSAVPLLLVRRRRQDALLHFPDGVIVAESVPRGDVLRAWTHCAAVAPSRWPDPCPLVAL